MVRGTCSATRQVLPIALAVTGNGPGRDVTADPGCAGRLGAQGAGRPDEDEAGNDLCPWPPSARALIFVVPKADAGTDVLRPTERAITHYGDYRRQLRSLPRGDWPRYLRERSGLPGPRANLSLAQALADEADEATLHALLATGDEYLVLCAVVGLGRLLAEGAADAEPELRMYASSDNWRAREGVAMALQRLGDLDPERLLDLVSSWAMSPEPLVQRAAVAGICEPRLLRTKAAASRALEVCDVVTRSLLARPLPQRKEQAVRTLRQALGYCWSVAVAADPAEGTPRFCALAGIDDPDVVWIVRENKKKARLAALLT